MVTDGRLSNIMKESSESEEECQMELRPERRFQKTPELSTFL